MRGDTTFVGDDLRQTDPKFQPRRYGQYLAAVDALDHLARARHQRGVLALAVRWILDTGETIALWGARTPAQLTPVADVLGWNVDGTTRAARRADAKGGGRAARAQGRRRADDGAGNGQAHHPGRGRSGEVRLGLRVLRRARRGLPGRAAPRDGRLAQLRPVRPDRRGAGG